MAKFDSNIFYPNSLYFFLSGGVLIWNIAYGYEHFSKDFAQYDQIVDGLIADKKWEYLCPIRRFSNMVFSDCGAAFLKGYQGTGVIDEGMVYLMKKCKDK